jgi:biuret amidohydrolase
MKHSHGLAIPTTLEDVCDPQRMALLVYDMQVGICSQIKSGSEIVTRISRLLAVARATGMRVAFTRHLSLPKSWMGATQFRMDWDQKSRAEKEVRFFIWWLSQMELS